MSPLSVQIRSWEKNLRKIRVENTLSDASIETIEGLATYLVFILRYVESPPTSVGHIEQLLKGHLSIVSGGRLENRRSNKPGSILHPSVRTVLRTFVNSIPDADADSPQRSHCLEMMSHLVKVVGSGKFPDSLTGHSHRCSHQLLSGLLGSEDTARPRKYSTPSP